MSVGLRIMNINRSAENTIYFMTIVPVFTSFIMLVSSDLM